MPYIPKKPRKWDQEGILETIGDVLDWQPDLKKSYTLLVKWAGGKLPTSKVTESNRIVLRSQTEDLKFRVRRMDYETKIAHIQEGLTQRKHIPRAKEVKRHLDGVRLHLEKLEAWYATGSLDEDTKSKPKDSGDR